MTIDVATWRERLANLATDGVSAAVVVQCDSAWLLPEFRAFRNEVDQALLAARLHRGASLTMNRIVLHNLPIGPVTTTRPSAVGRAFEEWHDRLSTADVLLAPTAPAAHRVHRLILRSNEAAAPVPDMVELLRDGEWTDHHRAELALRTIGSSGATTPLTGYDVNLDGPFGDSDPSVYM